MKRFIFSFLFFVLFQGEGVFAEEFPLEQDYSDYLKVIEVHPHGNKDFTEGLFFDDDKLYESTGIEENSVLKQIYPEKKVIYKLPQDEFGEGSVQFQGNFYYLTYQNHKAYCLGKKIQTFLYPYEGWGLTTDGSQLIASDGSSTLHFFDKDLKETRQLKITLAGLELNSLNELEFIDGLIWANIWKTNKIALIDPKTGQVIKVLNFDSLIQKYGLAIPQNNKVDVFNGIAYNPKTKTIWLTGKYYPVIFEMKQIKSVAK